MIKVLSRSRITGTVRRTVRNLDALATKLAGRTRVFVATWREGGNFGDDYLAEALSRYLKANLPKAKVIEVDLGVSGYRLTESDLLIVGGGGLWGPSGTGCLCSALYSRWMTVPARLVIANLGIESFDPSSADQLKSLCGKAAVFSVRDEWSWLTASKVVGEEKVLWAADTTYLSPIQVARSPVTQCIGVNVCGPEVENYTNEYSVDPIVAAILNLSGMGYRLKATVFSYGSLQSDYEHCRRVDSDCPREFTLAPYRNCEIFIGMRFHSVLLAMQNNIPVIAINYSHKVRRIMEEYGLDGLCLEPTDPALPDRLALLVKTMDRQDVKDRIRAGNLRACRRLVHFTRELHHAVSNNPT